MAERPKFRRKRRTLVEDIADVLPKSVPEAETAPIAPLETREQRLARRAAEARKSARDEAARNVEEQNRTQEAIRRGAEARAEARRRADEERRARQSEQDAATARLEDRKRAEEQARQKADAEAQARKEEQTRRAEAASQREAETRAAQKRKAKDRAIAEAAERRAKAAADSAAQAQQQEAARLQAEENALKSAQAEARAKARAIADAEAKAEAQAKAQAAAKADEDARAEKRRRLEARHEKEAARSRAESPTDVARPPRDPLTLQTPVLAAENPAPLPTLAEFWAQMSEFELDPRVLERNRIITASRKDPAHAAFDVLRTRLLQALAERGWSRVAITSPTKDCGKTFTAANLAISLARQENCGTLLLDLDMRAPSLHKVFGIKNPGSIGDMLRGRVGITDHLRRPAPNAINVGRNIAFGFNGTAEDYSAELLQDPTTAETLQKMQAALKPKVVLYDMPPALVSDDVIAFRAHFDAVLLIVGGGITTDAEIKEVERRLGEQTPLLGMVLNKAEGISSRKYAY